MDAVNKVVTAASTALWGEDGSQSQQSVQQHGEEPLSGVQGKGVPNDPYDAGNRDEQPYAPSTDVNTASQHPTLDGEPKNASSATAVDSVKSANDTPSGLAEANNPNYAAEASNPGSTEKKPSESTEQRDTTQTEGEDASNTGESSTHGPAPSHDVSEEALKGPQGPAPHPAEEYEKEAKGGKPKKEEPAKSSESSSSPSKKSGNSEQGAASGSGSGSNESGKSGASDKSSGSAMSKVKETLHKVAHPRHGNKE